jgi:parallel beta-helix repeat protein
MTDETEKKPPQGLTITPSSATLKPGETVQLTASNPQASWSSANPAIATVTSAGFVTAMSQAGETTIKAQYKGDKGSASITVEAVDVPIEPPVELPLTVAPASADFYPGDTVQAMASKPGVGWASSQPATASVDAGGLVTGVAAGNAAVTASVGSEQASMQITVRNRVDTGATPIEPGQDAQAIVNGKPAGTTFLFKAGVHRMQTISPRAGDIYEGEAGAILSGARLLTSFTTESGLYVATGQTQQGTVHGSCLASGPRCDYPEQLFIDNVMQLHVASKAAVVAGSWFFDYAVDKIYFADNPTSKVVETSVTTTAFNATANNVTIVGLTVEKYANLAQHGAIHADGTTGWTVRDNVVRWNHGVGIRVAATMRCLHNNVHHNGQMGIGGSLCDDALVEGNEIAYNNTANFDPGWEAGGTKFTESNRLIVRNNFSHHNNGPGLWTDINNINVLYEGNTVEDNAYMGIFHEISYACIIRNNIVKRNGFSKPEWIWGAGILVAASPNVEVYGNTVEGNADGIGAVQQVRVDTPSAYGLHEISNLYVHNNDVTMTEGWTGFVQDVGDNSYFLSRNNRFLANTYHVSGSATLFTWDNQELTLAQWQAKGLQ